MTNAVEEKSGGLKVTDRDAVLQLSGVIKSSIVDGPGLRYVVFAQGCPHGCAGCHNPETHPFEGGFLRTAGELLDEMAADPLLLGLTLSGGEPFCQCAAMAALARGAKAMGLEVAAYTGYTFEELLLMPQAAELLEVCDTIVDGPFLLAEKNLELRFRGSANQRTIDVGASLKRGAAVADTSYRWNG